jgi:pilus assembly protein CpaB
MKPKTLVLMVVAVTCGLGASYMTSRLLADRNADDAEKVAVLVAKKQIDNGSPIKVPQDLFEEKLFVKGEEPRDALAKLDDLKGRVLKRTLRPGDFIRAEDMLDSKDPLSFAVNLPEGYRAVGLRVNLEMIASGLASLPHSRVDIIQTVRRGDDKTSYAQVLLENVLVLAADTKTARDEGGNAMPASIITFALSPEDVLKLNLSREMGTLSLALRKPGDYRKYGGDKVTAADVRNGTSSKESSEESSEASTGSQTTGQLPMLPPLDASNAKPAEAVKDAGPAGNLHKLLIIEGDRVREVPYLIDPATGRVVTPLEVTPAPVVPTPARPTPGDRKESEE